MPSMKQIKKRKRSVESTGKITKAMKLVATVKLQKTKQTATEAVPYFDALYETVTDIIRHTAATSHKYLVGKPGGKKGVIVFSSNKGLAGGYNSSIVKKLFGEEAPYEFKKNDTLFYTIGTKVRDEIKRRGYTVEKDYSTLNDDVHYGTTVEIAEAILKDFTDGKINEIYLVYTFFKNTIVHIPRVLKIMPFKNVEKEMEETELIGKRTFTVVKSKYENDDKMPMNYEVDENDLLDALIPKYVASLLYWALTAAIASESGARMTAMDNATKNAKELSEKLGMMYNRARQGAITQELTEIVAGANAI